MELDFKQQVIWAEAAFLSSALGLYMHLWQHLIFERYMLLGLGFLTTVVAYFYLQILQHREVEPAALAVLIWSYGCLIFIGLSSVLQTSFGELLTRKRGEKWVKEIDYLYLLIGSLGVLGTLNRLPMSSHTLSGFDTIAPLTLATAIVLRLIKTRAEIGGWNKLDFFEDRKATIPKGVRAKILDRALELELDHEKSLRAHPHIRR